MYKTRYTTFDRSIHRFAMKLRPLQLYLAELETDAHERAIAELTIGKPIFITSLPRSGSTLLLQLLSSLPGVAGHRYRDMPFLFIPIFWNGLSRRFRRDQKLAERAHGDSVQINVDSPEAFEEVIWSYFWPEKYTEASIRLWTPEDSNIEFENFYQAHMRKLCYLQSLEMPCRECLHYIAKNSTHVARIAYLRKLYPESTIIIPFRNPKAQVASLLRQHRNFLGKNSEDRFVGEYMRSIGHFEFGPTVRHIETSDVDEWQVAPDLTSPDYWLTYWGRLYAHLLGHAGSCRFVDFDAMCKRPEPILEALVSDFGADSARVAALAAEVRSTSKREPLELSYSPQLLNRCVDIYTQLQEAAAT